jgi:hypothetical protein
VLSSTGQPISTLSFSVAHGSPFAQDGVLQFGAIPTPPPPNFVAQLTTASPVILSQTTPGALNPSVFDFTYDYLFRTTTGTLEVLLDGTVLDTLTAPMTLASSFTTRSLMVDGSAIPGTSHKLQFELDGPAGSQMLLDNVMFPGLLNRDFQTGVLDPWVASGNGTVLVIPFPPASSVPEPHSGVLGLLGLVGLYGFYKARRHFGNFDANKG